MLGIRLLMVSLLASVLPLQAAEPEVELVPKSAETPPRPRLIGEYENRPLPLTKVAPNDGEICSRFHLSFSAYPIDEVYLRKEGDTEMLLLVREKVVIGYLIRFQQAGSATELWKSSIASAMKEMLPESAYSRRIVSNGEDEGRNAYYVFELLHENAYSEATEAHMKAARERIKTVVEP